MRTIRLIPCFFLLLSSAALAQRELVLEGMVVQVVEREGEAPLITIAIDRQVQGLVRAGAITFEDPVGRWAVGDRSRFVLGPGAGGGPLYRAIAPEDAGEAVSVAAASGEGRVIHALDRASPPQGEAEAPPPEDPAGVSDADRAWGPADAAPPEAKEREGWSLSGTLAILLLAGLVGTITLRALRRR